MRLENLIFSIVSLSPEQAIIANSARVITNHGQDRYAILESVQYYLTPLFVYANFLIK